MKLKVDVREKRLIKLLEAYISQFNFKNIVIEIETLPLGDVIICDEGGNEKIILERKSLNDLASSIKDGRYVEQSHRLTNNPIHNHNIIYLIEGDIDSYRTPPIKNPVTKEALYSSIFSILYFKGFSVIKTKDLKETAKFISRIYAKMVKEKKEGYYSSNVKETNVEYTSTIKTSKKDNITLENIDLIMLSQIPNVSINIANAILSKFNSLGDLINSLKSNSEILTGITYEVASGKSRKISKTAIENVIKYLKI